MEDNRKVKVVNRTGNGVVCYSIPDMGNLVRTFQDGEEKILTYEEMRKLSYILQPPEREQELTASVGQIKQ